MPGRTPAPRYDEHADWYDGWSRTVGAPFMAGVAATLRELVPEGSGPALDIGCGTGFHADTVRSLGWSPIGTDLSSGQLRYAAVRLPVARADARALPLADDSLRLSLSVLTSTDVPSYADLVAEAVRVLAPGGWFVHVGVHPCFISPYAEPEATGVRVGAGYRTAGWAPRTPHIGDAVRARVGVHHLPLQDLMAALTSADAAIDRVVERGEGPVPPLLAVRLRCR
jgi:SAM-dependent methyltransferase